jgi:hypothetical protein
VKVCRHARHVHPGGLQIDAVLGWTRLAAQGCAVGAKGEIADLGLKIPLIVAYLSEFRLVVRGLEPQIGGSGSH